MANPVNLTTPVGRLVRGSLYKGNDKDAEGKPLVVKTGPQAGTPRLDYYFAIAIPKGTETHWASTAWGAEIWNTGYAAFPQAAGSPAFAWKVIDGDSQVPNKKGKKPCDNTGYPGHWVVGFSSGYPPNLYRARPGVPGQFDPFNEPDAIKLGHYVQVNFNVAGNGSQSQPGVYLNHRMICFSAFGPEIAVGPDASSAGFGQAPLPAGASLTPPPGSFGAASATPPAPPGAPAAPPAPPGAPVAPPAPPAPPAAPAPAGLVMTAAANGATAEQYRASGWNDEQMIAAGVAVRM